MKPFDLAAKLQNAVAECTGCTGSWGGPDSKKSRGPVTREELKRIRICVLRIIDEELER